MANALATPADRRAPRFSSVGATAWPRGHAPRVRGLVALAFVALSNPALAALIAPSAASVTPGTQSAAAPLPAPPAVDRIVAVVDDDPILDSDLRQSIGLGLVPRGKDESDSALLRRALDLQIQERLRLHEIDRYGFSEVAVGQIEKSVAAIRQGFASEEDFRRRLREVGLSEDGLRQVVARQLMVLAYVEERLGARVFVGLDDIEAYYRGALTAESRRHGVEPPPLEQVREKIRSVLREQRLNREITRWTEELRRKADVVDHFDSVHAELPAIVYEMPAAAVATGRKPPT